MTRLFKDSHTSHTVTVVHETRNHVYANPVTKDGQIKVSVEIFYRDWKQCGWIEDNSTD